MTLAPNVKVKRLPVSPAQLLESRAGFGRILLTGRKHNAPVRRGKPRPFGCGCSFVRLAGQRANHRKGARSSQEKALVERAANSCKKWVSARSLINPETAW